MPLWNFLGLGQKKELTPEQVLEQEKLKKIQKEIASEIIKQTHNMIVNMSRRNNRVDVEIKEKNNYIIIFKCYPFVSVSFVIKVVINVEKKGAELSVSGRGRKIYYSMDNLKDFIHIVENRIEMI